jgi:thymidylate synthase (FAD)
MTQIDVLDHGFVRLDDCMADDWSVVNAARVSFNRQSLEPEEWGNAEEGLINFLMKNRHGTPFEHNSFRFHIKCPIFVAREWMRHRIGSFNEWSGRYSKLEREFYIPDNIRSQVGKPGAYTFEPVIPSLKEEVQAILEYASDGAFNAYEHMLKAGIAKEVARLVLPVNIYTQFYWTINARSLMNFLSLRNSEQAMYEIHEYAKAVEEFFEEVMPVTKRAFEKNYRVAP